jgi:hypothetical protein
MSRKVKESLSRALVAGALVLLSQAALSGEGQEVTRAPEVIRVTLPHDWIAFASPSIELDTSQQFKALSDALDKSVAKDIARRIEMLDVSRVELAIAEVPTRG